MNTKINTKLKEQILIHGLTQENVANEIGINPMTLSRKINGKTDFTEGEIRKLCKMFNKSPMELFFYRPFDNLAS